MKASIIRCVGGSLVAFTLLAGASEPPKKWKEIRTEALQDCQGKFKDKAPTPLELRALLADHKSWLEVYWGKTNSSEAQADPRKANLCGADLSRSDLRRADLRAADLNGARLGGLDNQGDLQQTDLDEAQMRGVVAMEAKLRGATLNEANLTGADLIGADLRFADLARASLSGARLWGANLQGVRFEVQSLPEATDIATAENLSKLSFYFDPQALHSLRKAFEDSGFYHQEREITFAIERTETGHLIVEGSSGHLRSVPKLLEALFRYVFFDLTCQWGMTPGRALLILLAIIPVFAIPYVIALLVPGQDGIWLKWADDRVRVDLGAKEPTRLHVRWREALTIGLHFSVLSAFSIGWRDLNVGNWIQRLQAKEYTLQPTGWLRTVSGAQSLVSVYLLAIWALSYFGRPFE